MVLVVMPYRVSSFRVTRVSSQTIKLAVPRTSRARKVMSRRLPMGVATGYSPALNKRMGACSHCAAPLGSRALELLAID